MNDAPLKVVQLSDLHFSTSPDGYSWRNTSESFAVVAEHCMGDPPDLVVVTGDIANEGRAEEYALAGSALEALGAPVYCLAGNHDSTDAIHAHLPRPGVVLQRTLTVGGWLFLFGDSNAGGTEFDPERGWIDTPRRIHDATGGFTDHEFSWLRRQLQESTRNVMLWVHHPPGSSKFFEQPEYDTQVGRLCADAPRLRAIAAGHAHTGVTVQIGGIPSHICPSTGMSIDFETLTVMPPGYRRYKFWPDGRLDSEVVWLDESRWSERRALPAIAAEYFAGRVSSEAMKAALQR